MAEYSKEYTDLTNLTSSDFSFLSIGSELKEGQTVNIICEGFGVYGITQIDSVLYLLTSSDGLKKVDYSSFIQNWKQQNSI